MTGTELRAALSALGVSQRWLAARLGVHEVTVYRWCEQEEIPARVAFPIELLRRLPVQDRAAIIAGTNQIPRL